MSPGLNLVRSASLLGLSLLLVACLGTEVKKLGTGEIEPGGDPVTDADSFSITVAYRNDTSDGRTLVLQGARGIPSAALINLCGSSGASCRCSFYESFTDTSPVLGDLEDNGLSSENNSISCQLPATLPTGKVVDDYKKVRLSTVDGTKSTGFLDISLSVTLADALGSLDKTGVRGIYHYGCTRFFFEGEGVTSPNTITCPANQKLGLITAKYSAYLFRSSSESNEGDKQGSIFYEDAICERAALFEKLACDTTSTQVFGLYATQNEQFPLSVTMNPTFEQATRTIYGYAAKPDSSGNCPLGLVAARPWTATPPSIIAGSLGSNPPSTFVQVESGALDNTRIELSQPGNFLVQRQPNANDCEADGKCTNVSFAGIQVAHQVVYTARSPIICVIPPALLTGLF